MSEDTKRMSVTIEGSMGVGKTTAAYRLAEILSAAGWIVTIDGDDYDQDVRDQPYAGIVHITTRISKEKSR